MKIEGAVTPWARAGVLFGVILGNRFEMAVQYRENRRFDGSVCAEGLVIVRGSIVVGSVPRVSVCVLEKSVGTQVAAEDIDDTLMVGALVGVGHVSQCVNSSDAHLW